MSLEGSLTIETFRRRLKGDLESICADRGWDYSNNKQRGTAFELWFADLLRRANHGIDTPPDEAVLGTSDLLADVVLEDAIAERLVIAQCKSGSLSKTAQATDEVSLSAFFDRHRKWQDREWIRQHGSERAYQLLGDYKERVESGWSVSLYFVTTDQLGDKAKQVTDKKNEEYAEAGISVLCTALGLSELKELFARTESLEGAIGVDIDQPLPAGEYFVRRDPFPTLVCAIKANWLRNVYNQHGVKERLFALNIRDWLGRRTQINKDIVSTARKEPEHFFYFNNGISAVCTHLDVNTTTHRLVATNFQIINGAQTVGAIVDAAPDQAVYVLMRITQASSSKTQSAGINERIIKYNNSQNVIKLSDFFANDHIQLWLESEFNKQKHRETLPTVTYQRRRGSQTKTKKGSRILRIEDLAKIRFAFEREATLPINAPKDLFTRHRDSSSGAYEDAFGVDGKLDTMWPTDVFARCLLGIAVYWRLEAELDNINRDDPLRRVYQQMRYHFVALAGEMFRRNKTPDESLTLLNNSKRFDEYWQTVWRAGQFAIRSEWKRVDPSAVTLRTFSRSREYRDRIQDNFFDFVAST